MPTGRFLPQDAENALRVIDITKSRINQGLHFITSHTISVGTGTAVTMLMSIPASGNYHAIVRCEAKKAGTFSWSEAPNASGGTSITSYNNDRRSTTTAGLTLTHTVTYVSSGSVIETHVIGGTDGPYISTSPYILNNGTLYLARFMADGAATEVVIELDCYKES